MASPLATSQSKRLLLPRRQPAQTPGQGRVRGEGGGEGGPGRSSALSPHSTTVGVPQLVHTFAPGTEPDEDELARVAGSGLDLFLAGYART
ncbi:hypothetical protein [Streptomyces sp. NPDC127114]|uniref:hypothetical protein n=1 Tax=Streptomyces sp. NPDC127114 TaxID=3345366 RepID=UPI00362BDC41